MHPQNNTFTLTVCKISQDLHKPNGRNYITLKIVVFRYRGYDWRPWRPWHTGKWSLVDYWKFLLQISVTEIPSICIFEILLNMIVWLLYLVNHRFLFLEAFHPFSWVKEIALNAFGGSLVCFEMGISSASCEIMTKNLVPDNSHTLQPKTQTHITIIRLYLTLLQIFTNTRY